MVVLLWHWKHVVGYSVIDYENREVETFIMTCMMPDKNSHPCTRFPSEISFLTISKFPPDYRVLGVSPCTTLPHDLFETASEMELPDRLRLQRKQHLQPTKSSFSIPMRRLCMVGNIVQKGFFSSWHLHQWQIG